MRASSEGGSLLEPVFPLPTYGTTASSVERVKIQPYIGAFDRNLRENVLEACGLFIFFMAIPVAFACLYHVLPKAVALIVLGCSLLAIAPLSAGASLLASNLMAGVLICTFCGLYSYHGLVQPLRVLRHGRSSSNVFASEPSIAYSDAVLLNFAADATVDGTKSLGMTTLDGGVATYCVAPIVDSQSTGRVEFWAVGLNCCGKLANFHCDGAGDPAIRGGDVIMDSRDSDVWFDVLGKHFAPRIYRRDLFLEAVALAEQVHGVASSARPVMLHWSGLSRGQLVTHAWLLLSLSAVGGCFISVAAALMLAPAVKQLRVRLREEGRRSQEQRQQQQQQQQQQEQRMDFRHVVLQGFVLPFCAFALCAVFGSYAHCWDAGAAILTAIRLALGFATLSLLASSWGLRHGILLALVCLVASFVGHLNDMHNTSQYCAVVARRSYSNVKADAHVQELQDAGKLHFEKTVVVDANHSVGLRHRGVTYCAAPLVAPTCVGGGPVVASPAFAPAPAPASVVVPACGASFWAVGTECCGSRGGFMCGAGDGNGRLGNGPSALVLRGGAQERLPYLRAAKAAADLHGLLLPDQPMLLRATQRGGLDGVLQDWKGRGIGVCLLATGLSFFALASIVWAGLLLGQGRRLDFTI